MKKLLTFFTLIIFSMNFAAAQMPVSELSKSTHIKHLKEGLLLVQLPNQDEKINRLKGIGQHKKAAKEEEELEFLKTTLIEGFSEKFDYCNTLFFEARHTPEVLGGNYENVFNKIGDPIIEMKFKDFDNIYITQYGYGHPAGETYRYNQVGSQIYHVKEGQLEAIKSDVFFSRSPFNMMDFLVKRRKKMILKGIGNLNNSLRKQYNKL